MATTTRKRTRKRGEQMPKWAADFLRTGQPPQRGEPGFDEYVGWKFFGDEVEGMVDADEYYRRPMWKES